jgi:spore coat protein A, manganese oxidase
MKRREFLRWSALGGAALLARPRLGWAFSNSPPLRKFIQPLIGLGPTGIPVATPDRSTYPGTDLYRLETAEFRHQFHPDLNPSRVWGYADLNGPHGYLGGVIVAQKNRPVRLRMCNKLPARHPLPIDTTLDGADQGPNRIAVHLHGGLVPWNSDGGPLTWFDPYGNTGESFAQPGGPGWAEYYYPNAQSARLMWYHDHAMGITRLNAYAGLATAYLLRDDLEQALIATGIIPSREVPLVLQDKSFVDGSDGDYPSGQTGDLWYPYRYEADRWELAPGGQPPVPSCVPEFFADSSVVNGAVSPYLEVEQRHYRFRILNGSQARFFNLQLYYATDDGFQARLDKPGPAFVQIGTEGGFLPGPVLLNSPPRPFATDPAGNVTGYTLLLAPAERADVVIDFSNVPAGARLVLYNDAPAPFPMGDPANDYQSGAAGPDTRNLLQFRVVPRSGARDPFQMDELYRQALKGTRGILPGILALPAAFARVRHLTLNEDFDGYGRLIQKLGTAAGGAMAYMDAPTEVARNGALEVWNVYNLTGDVHPIHFHLANVQVLWRRPFDANAWNGSPSWTGPSRPPDANELGWKETVRMNPGECTSVIMKLDLPVVPFAVPPSPRTGGHEYVWHCHILEHEEHDMMRPLVVNP